MVQPESSPRPSQAPPPSPLEEIPTQEVRLETTRTESGTKACVADDFLGNVIAGYEIIRKLGQGGMGAVYQARHLRLDKFVALKLLPSHLLQDRESVQRFEREMRALGKLEHPHLVQAYDAGDADGLFYLALELVDGGDLSHRVKKHGPLPVWVACRLIREAALALDYVHQQGMVHRDIKPANLMLTKSGHLKISDLGLARLADDPLAEALTHTGACMGTPDYMAPEQWDNTHAVDGRADLYALGCTLYFLLVGRAPWQTNECGTMPSKMKAHVMGPVPSLQSLCPEVPDALEAIYQKLLAKQPERRYATGEELAEALTPFAEKPGNAHDGTSGLTVALPASATESTQPTLPTLTLPTLAPRPVAHSRRAASQGAGSGRGRSKGWLLGLGGGGMALLLLGIVIKITQEDGTTTEIPVPENARVEIIQDIASPAMAPAKPTTKQQPPKAAALQELTDDEVERKVAEWALASGGTGLAYINDALDKWHTLETGNLLSEPFSIFMLTLGKGASSDDYEMSLLPRLKMLESLGVTADESRANLFTKLLPVHSLRSLRLTRFPADGSLLPKFSNLTEVKLHSPPSPADLEALAQLPNLYSLEIEWFQGEDIRFLSKYPAIRMVYFDKPRVEIDESTVLQLQRQTPDLRIIVQTDQGQQHLGTDTNRHAAAQLFAAGVTMKIRPIPYGGGEKVATQDDFDSSRPFLVARIEFPAEGSKSISPELLTQIDYWGDLHLPSYNTIEYVQAVSAQRRITSLNFAPSTHLDAAAIEALQKMIWLRRLFLGTTDLTADQVAQLRTALPYTEIYSAFGTFPPLADDTSP